MPLGQEIPDRPPAQPAESRLVEIRWVSHKFGGEHVSQVPVSGTDSDAQAMLWAAFALGVMLPSNDCLQLESAKVIEDAGD